MHLLEIILQKNKSYFEEELAKNRSKPKELWKILKSPDLNSGKVRKSKIYLKKDGTIHFEALENANTFKRFYYELAYELHTCIHTYIHIYINNYLYLQQSAQYLELSYMVLKKNSSILTSH